MFTLIFEDELQENIKSDYFQIVYKLVQGKGDLFIQGKGELLRWAEMKQPLQEKCIMPRLRSFLVTQWYQYLPYLH